MFSFKNGGGKGFYEFESNILGIFFFSNNLKSVRFFFFKRYFFQMFTIDLPNVIKTAIHL